MMEFWWSGVQDQHSEISWFIPDYSHYYPKYNKAVIYYRSGMISNCLLIEEESTPKKAVLKVKQSKVAHILKHHAVNVYDMIWYDCM
jgi:hypothetical protein